MNTFIVTLTFIAFAFGFIMQSQKIKSVKETLEDLQIKLDFCIEEREQNYLRAQIKQCQERLSSLETKKLLGTIVFVVIIMVIVIMLFSMIPN